MRHMSPMPLMKEARLGMKNITFRREQIYSADLRNEHRI